MWRRILVVTGTVIIAVVAVLFLIQDDKEERGLESLFAASPACESLPEHGSDNSISLQVSRIANHPDIVCVRVYNGTRKPIGFTPESLRLESRWGGLIWVPYFRLTNIFPLGRVFSRMPLFAIQLGTYRDRYLPSPDDSVLAGRCRVRLRYRVIPNEEEHTVYSAPFSLP